VTPKQFLPVAIVTGLLGATLQLVDIFLHAHVPPVANVGLSWMAFQAWAMYFFAGNTVRGGVRAFIGYFAGMVLSIGIMSLGGTFGGLGFIAVPLAIAILVPIILYLELAPELFSLVPAVFIGAGAFFASMSYIPNATYGTVTIAGAVYCALGLVFGWLTISFRTWYGQRTGPTQDPADQEISVVDA
jgi:hypothetical protein